MTALVAGPVPGLVVVEDVQWADDASREARPVPRPPADRAPAPARAHVALGGARRRRALAFADAVDALPDTVRVPLERLATDGRCDARGCRGRRRDRLGSPRASPPSPRACRCTSWRRIAAGPSAAGEAPRGVRALLHERLASVGETAAQVLAAAAVIGRTFDLGTVRAASGRSEDETIDALEELVRRAIVREADRGGEPVFDFGHARLRDAAYEEIGLARRRLLHRRVAEVLRSRGRQDAARLAQIAGHELAAGRDAAAADAYRDAGLMARAVFANREALEHLSAALALGHPDVVGLELAIGEARTALGDYAGAIVALEAAAAASDDERARRDRAAAGPGPRPARRRPDRGLASRRGARGHDRPGRTCRRSSSSAAPSRSARATWRSRARLADEAAAIAATLDDPRAEASIARLAGLVAHRAGDPATAHAELARSLELADDRGRRRSRARRSPPGTRSRSSRRSAATGPRRSPCSRRRSPSVAGRASPTSRRRSRTTSPTSCMRPAGRRRR